MRGVFLIDLMNSFSQSWKFLMNRNQIMIDLTPATGSLAALVSSRMGSYRGYHLIDPTPPSGSQAIP